MLPKPPRLHPEDRHSPIVTLTRVAWSKPVAFTTASGQRLENLRLSATGSLSSISSSRKKLPLPLKIQRNQHCLVWPLHVMRQAEFGLSSVKTDPAMRDRS